MPAGRSLALVPPEALRRGLGRSRLVAVGLLVAALGSVGAYAVARETSLFAVRSIEVEGAPREVARTVSEVAGAVRGESLVALDREALERRLERLPVVADADLDRAFPHGLRITVVPERPVAVVRAGRLAWVVSDGGRVIAAVDPAAAPSLPRLWLPSAAAPNPGETLDQSRHADAVRVLARLSRDFPARVAAARSAGGEVTLVLGDRAELRLGGLEDVGLKLDVAEAVLTAMTWSERSTLVYLDVSVPERPVVDLNSQLETGA
jgi:cell division protein FtsQ